jgi:uncharacterized protein (TIGR01244 family)
LPSHGNVGKLFNDKLPDGWLGEPHEKRNNLRGIIVKLPMIVVVLAAAAIACAAGSGEVTKIDATGIGNFSRIDGTTGIAGTTAGFGGATEPSAMAGLKEYGFASVINLRLATEDGADVDASRAAAEAVGLKYIHMPFNTAAPDPHFVENFAAALGDTTNQPAYIHCGSATRAAALWMISRVLEDGWNIADAQKEAEAIAAKPADAVAFATKYLASQEH